MLNFFLASCVMEFIYYYDMITDQETSGRKVFVTLANGSEETLNLSAWVVFYQNGKPVYERTANELKLVAGRLL